MNIWTDQELDAIQDAEHREAAWATDDLPQTGGRVVVLQKSGPAFAVSAPVPQAAILTAAGEVLDAIDRKVMMDLVPAWDRLVALLVLSPVRLPGTVQPWGTDPWGRVKYAVTKALRYSTDPAAAATWLAADALICAWVRHHRNCLAKELYRETNLTEEERLEDGPADEVHNRFLASKIDLYTRFVSALQRSHTAVTNTTIGRGSHVEGKK